MLDQVLRNPENSYLFWYFRGLFCFHKDNKTVLLAAFDLTQRKCKGQTIYFCRPVAMSLGTWYSSTFYIFQQFKSANSVFQFFWSTMKHHLDPSESFDPMFWKPRLSALIAQIDQTDHASILRIWTPLHRPLSQYDAVSAWTLTSLRSLGVTKSTHNGLRWRVNSPWCRNRNTWKFQANSVFSRQNCILLCAVVHFHDHRLKSASWK